MKIDSTLSEADRAKYKIVRLDSFSDVEGVIVTADEATGDCSMNVKGESKTHSFGADGMRIIPRR